MLDAYRHALTFEVSAAVSSMNCWYKNMVKLQAVQGICSLIKKILLSVHIAIGKIRSVYFAALAALMDSMSSGTTLNRSPTMP